MSVSDKVKIPAGIGALVTSVFALLAFLGIDVPDFVNEEWAMWVIGLVFGLYQAAMAVVGYYTKEGSPSPSAVETVHEQQL